MKHSARDARGARDARDASGARGARGTRGARPIPLYYTLTIGEVTITSTGDVYITKTRIN